MANLVTDKCKNDLFTGATNLATAALRMLLLKSGGAAAGTTNFVSDLTPGTNEISVAGYSRQTLGGLTVTRDDVNFFVYLSATNPTFTALAAGQTVTQAILYRFVTVDADSPVYAQYTVTATPTNGGDIGITFSSAANGGALKGA